jgi:hypothetical protein
MLQHQAVCQCWLSSLTAIRSQHVCMYECHSLWLAVAVLEDACAEVVIWVISCLFPVRWFCRCIVERPVWSRACTPTHPPPPPPAPAPAPTHPPTSTHMHACTVACQTAIKRNSQSGLRTRETLVTRTSQLTHAAAYQSGCTRKQT